MLTWFVLPADDVESVIVAAAQRLESAGVPENQLHIHFIQIGDDQAATNALQRLDNALSGHHRIRVCFTTQRCAIRILTNILGHSWYEDVFSTSIAWIAKLSDRYDTLTDTIQNPDTLQHYTDNVEEANKRKPEHRNGRNFEFSSLLSFNNFTTVTFIRLIAHSTSL